MIKFLSAFILILTACFYENTDLSFSSTNDSASNLVKLTEYWYQGKAEISTYDLEQNRYQDLHDGKVILVQVSEDFLPDKQVKNDNYVNSNSVGILKSNLITRFTTGLYDYSMMTSTFTDLNGEFSHKVTNSAQDWCGQSWSQINKKKSGYHMELRSYFESEGDKTNKLEETQLEDQIFNQIRILKEKMPQGQMGILPSLNVQRYLHLEQKAVNASVNFVTMYHGKQLTDTGLIVYKIEMPTIKRTVEILINKNEEYAIEGWTDTYPSVFDRKPRTTVAKLSKRVLTDYWNKNGKMDTEWRTKLGIE